MKKLITLCMIAIAAIAGMASPCNTCEALDTCAAYDVKLTLKALSLKKMVCKGCGPCGERTTVYYIDNETRTIKGYAWFCEYACPQQYHLVLWDPKRQMDQIAPLDADGNPTCELTFNSLVYGKTAKSVAAYGEIATDTASLVLAGVKGTYKKLQNCDSCEVLLNTISGNVAGKLALPVKSFAVTKYTVTGGGSLCAPPEISTETTDIQVVTASFCDMCSFTDWCTSGQELTDAMLPTCGTWTMKYNKKISTSSTPIARLVPVYAIAQ